MGGRRSLPVALFALVLLATLGIILFGYREAGSVEGGPAGSAPPVVTGRDQQAPRSAQPSPPHSKATPATRPEPQAPVLATLAPPPPPPDLSYDPMSYASAARNYRLAWFGRYDVANYPWHWTDVEFAGLLEGLRKPDPGPSWRPDFDAAASGELSPRSELGSKVFVRLGRQLGKVVPAEPADEVFPNGPPKCATETMQSLVLSLLRIKCLVGRPEQQQCRMYPAVAANSSLAWLFTHGLDTYFEDVRTGGLTLLLAGNYPFSADVGVNTTELKHTSPVTVESWFQALGPASWAPRRRVFLNIVRALLPRTISNAYHASVVYEHKTTQETTEELQAGRIWRLLPPESVSSYSRTMSPLDVRRRTYYMQAEVLFDPDYKPHVISDMARFMLGDGADAEVVQQAVRLLAKFEAPRMDHGMKHPPFTEVITDTLLAKIKAVEAPRLPEILLRMYPLPETMEGPFLTRLCNLNQYLWDLEEDILCNPFGTYA